MENKVFSKKNDFFTHLNSNIRLRSKTDFFEIYGFSNIKQNGDDVAVSFRGLNIDLEGTIFIYKSEEDIMNPVRFFVKYSEKNKTNYEYVVGNNIIFSGMNGLFSAVSFDDKYHGFFKKKLLSAILIVRSNDWVIKYRITQPVSSLKASAALYDKNKTNLIKELEKLIVVDLNK